MSRPCSACADPRRAELDAALVSGAAFRAIARRFAPLSRDAIRRHRPHVGTALVRAADARRGDEAETLLQKVERLEADARRIGERAESEGDLRAALVANKGLMDVIRLLHELAPPKTPAPADAIRFAEKLAADAGVSVEELLTLAEKIAGACEGEIGSPLVLGAIAAAADAARSAPRTEPVAALAAPPTGTPGTVPAPEQSTWRVRI